MKRTEEQKKVEKHIIYSKEISENFKKNSSFKQLFRKVRRYQKKETDFMEYKVQERTINRTIENDREFPLDNITIHTINTNENYDKAMIHTGMSADEFARSFHALALTIGKDIFFRNGAYKPETEEGQKLLAHELTHVEQNENKAFVENRSVEEFEEEAEKSEEQINKHNDPVIVKNIEGRNYALKKSQWQKIKKMALEELEEMVENREANMSDEEYLNLLLKYEDWTKYEANTWLI